MDKNTLSHTTWECKYHIVFAPKYKRQVIYGNIKGEMIFTPDEPLLDFTSIPIPKSEYS
ncbi:hypothetical protein GCM10023142_08010 [Anaerocolumna aminovalerica]